jgi:hypothetical protein
MAFRRASCPVNFLRFVSFFVCILGYQVLDRNWVPLLLGWLQLHQRPAVQVEALWALTNIAAGTAEHTNVLIKHGAVPTLVDLLSSPNEEVIIQPSFLAFQCLHRRSDLLRFCLLCTGTLSLIC